MGESVTIPATVGQTNVTGIKNYAFQEVRSLKTVTFEANNNFTIIGEGAFQGCSALTNVNIQGGVTSIDREAFNGCSSLVSFIIPNSVNSIGAGAFAECTSLASISIPNSVNSIDFGAFGKCNLLTSVDVNWTIEQLKKLTFRKIFYLINAIAINAKNPDGHSHDELLNKYQEMFTTESTGATSITVNVDPDLQPEPITQNFNWAVLLGSIFGVIFTSGLTATFGIYLKEKKN